MSELLQTQRGVFVVIESQGKRYVVPTVTEDKSKFEFLLHKNGRESLANPHILPDKHDYLANAKYGLLGGKVEEGQDLPAAAAAEVAQEFSELFSQRIVDQPELLERFLTTIFDSLSHAGEVMDVRVAQTKQNAEGQHVPRGVFDIDQFVAQLPDTPEVLADVAELEKVGLLVNVEQLFQQGQSQLIRPFARHILAQVATGQTLETEQL